MRNVWRMLLALAVGFGSGAPAHQGNRAPLLAAKPTPATAAVWRPGGLPFALVASHLTERACTSTEKGFLGCMAALQSLSSLGPEPLVLLPADAPAPLVARFGNVRMSFGPARAHTLLAPTPA